MNSQNALLTRQNEAKFSGFTTFCTMPGSRSSGRSLNVVMDSGNGSACQQLSVLGWNPASNSVGGRKWEGGGGGEEREEGTSE